MVRQLLLHQGKNGMDKPRHPPHAMVMILRFQIYRTLTPSVQLLLCHVPNQPTETV